MPSTSPPQPPAGDPANPSASGAKPFLRFYYPESLRAKTLALLTTIEQAPDPTRHRNALSDLVMDLTDSGLEYYFLRALDLAKVGFVTKQSAIAGFGTAKRVMGPVVHNVVGHLDKEQLLIICRHIRQLME